MTAHPRPDYSICYLRSGCGRDIAPAAHVSRSLLFEFANCLASSRTATAPSCPTTTPAATRRSSWRTTWPEPLPVPMRSGDGWHAGHPGWPTTRPASSPPASWRSRCGGEPTSSANVLASAPSIGPASGSPPSAASTRTESNGSLRHHRKQQRDEQRRRDSGQVSRSKYLTVSARRERPWEAAGVSRATWYRRREHDPRPPYC